MMVRTTGQVQGITTSCGSSKKYQPRILRAFALARTEVRRSREDRDPGSSQPRLRHRPRLANQGDFLPHRHPTHWPLFGCR